MAETPGGIRPEIEDAIVCLMAKHKLNRQQAEKALLAGFKKMSSLAGQPIPPGGLSLTSLSALIESGRFSALERVAKRKMSAFADHRKLMASPGTFELSVPKNKYI